MADLEQEELAQAAQETENELMKQAFEPAKPQGEAPLEEPESPEPPPEPPKVERTRDAQGRFIAARPDEAATEGARPEEESEVLPSWRAREINEERRRVQAENDAIRAEYARVQARLAQIEQAQQRQQQPAPELIDPVLDPKGFVKQFTENLTAQFEQRVQSIALTNNLEVAHVRYGETFEKAYEAVLTQGQRGNNALVRQLIAQPNPGEAIVRWYNDALIRSEVGNDLAGFRKKERESLLDDDAMYEEMTERRRARAAGSTGQPPNTVVRLPPSLSKATGQSDSGPPGTTPATDGSEAALFAYAMQPKRR